MTADQLSVTLCPGSMKLKVLLKLLITGSVVSTVKANDDVPVPAGVVTEAVTESGTEAETETEADSETDSESEPDFGRCQAM